MFRIGEFSKLTQVSIRMLRYYDKKGLLKPAETDKFTGYRMYSASQIPMLQKIILLRDSRFSTEEIKKIIIEDKEVNIANELQKKKLEIQKEIAMEQNRIKNIDKAISEINRNSLKMHCNINFKKVDKLNIVSIRDIIPTYFDEHILWNKLCSFVKKEHISISNSMYNNIAIYHDTEHKDYGVDVEVGVIVDKLGKSKDGFIYREVEQVEKMAYAMIYGPYENLAKGYEMLAYYLENNNEHMAEAPSRQICHIGAGDTKNPDEYLTEIQIPIK